MSRDYVVVHLLWATSDRYKTPQFVAAWSDGMVEGYCEMYYEKRAEAIEEFSTFGDASDGPWSFWSTVEHIDMPACAHQFQHHPESEDVGVCSTCGAEEMVA